MTQRFVIEWRTKSMSAPAYYYYNVDDKGRVTVDGDDSRSYDLMTLAGEVMTFVQDGSLVSFRPVQKEG